MLHLTQDGCTVSRWSGGTTTQLAIFPPGASYQDRDFLWRISSAVVEDERSTFTELPDYDRWLLLLEGSMLLAHDGGAPFRLEPGRAHAFDGGAATEGVGRCRDFNLMLRKGRCRGTLRPIRFSGAGESVLHIQTPAQDALSRSTLLLYCAAGAGEAAMAGERCVLAAGESILVEDARDMELRLTVPGAADFAAAEIVY